LSGIWTGFGWLRVFSGVCCALIGIAFIVARFLAVFVAAAAVALAVPLTWYRRQRVRPKYSCDPPGGFGGHADCLAAVAGVNLDCCTCFALLDGLVVFGLSFIDEES